MLNLCSRKNMLAFNGRMVILLLLLSLGACGPGTSSQPIRALLKAQNVDVSQLPLSHLTVYVSGGDKTVHALRASDGYSRWSYQVSDAANLTLVNGVLFVNSYDGSVTALQASNGHVLWRHQDGKFAYGDSFLATQTIVAYCSYQEPQNNFLGLKVGQVVMHVLNASDGSELWQANCGDVTTDLNGTLYSIDGSLSAYQETTGKKLWQTSFARNSTSTRPAIIGTTMYINAGREGVFALDATHGKVLWKASFSTKEDTVGFTSVVADKLHGIVYAGVGSTLYAFHAGDGSRFWQMPVEGGGQFMRPLVLAAGNLYVSAGVNASTNEPYSFFVLRASDGNVRWGSRVTSSDRSLPVVASGVVFVGDTSGTLHALDVSDGTEIWHFVSGDSIQAPLALGGN